MARIELFFFMAVHVVLCFRFLTQTVLIEPVLAFAEVFESVSSLFLTLPSQWIDSSGHTICWEGTQGGRLLKLTKVIFHTIKHQARWEKGKLGGSGGGVGILVTFCLGSGWASVWPGEVMSDYLSSLALFSSLCFYLYLTSWTVSLSWLQSFLTFILLYLFSHPLGRRRVSKSCVVLNCPLGLTHNRNKSLYIKVILEAKGKELLNLYTMLNTKF